MTSAGPDDYDEEEPIEDIDPDRIVFNISKTPYGVKVIWRVANNNADPQCFNTEVQYKRQCEKDWERSHRIKLQNNQEENHLNLSTLSTKMNYDFRIRMKYECLEKDWSNWTKVQSWGNNKDVCMVKSSYYIWVYILIIMLPLITFLLFCLLIQQRIRKLLLPEVPDPKHLKHKIMDTEQFQWWGNLTQRNEDCPTTDVEIIDKSESEEVHQTLVTQPTDTIPEQHDSMYYIYSSETLGENTDLQYSKSVLGYIALEDYNK
ncbi:cytokine receptor-like factor 2 [Danio rerio]|uniref:Cytokine receptor-like factor 2 n=7 Tax=Danio rerio TaxID=7955 RepID=C0Z3T1_DANRE|nr:cytokine receptor-like factor 2 [Danio rerio]CAM88660.1 thymic stromal-derived lymphopoietin receptor [Danio rerio]|eukprot:NP_001153142.1 cytokine receptor-like factor 2 [Danio rerio]